MNAEAERYVLGSVMISRAACEQVTELLQAADMAVPIHQTIYAAVRRLHDQELLTDVVSVGDELTRAGEMVGTLDVPYLHGLVDAVPTASNASYWAGIVRDAATRRRVREGAEKAIALADDASIATEDVVELAREAMDEQVSEATPSVEAVGDWLMDYVQDLSTKPSYTPTPWVDLNQLIYGFRDGGIYVFGARPGDGKSIMAVQVALSLAKERPVLFVSLEMNRREIAARAIASMAQVFIGSLNRHQLSDAEWKALASKRQELADLPLVVVDSSEVSTIPQLKAKVRAVKRKYRQNPVVIVDYLQLLVSPGRVESRQVEIASFSRELKLSAQRWGVPVIALSQLNRSGANRKGKAAEPQLSDLRESGAIEQDADVVLLLHRHRVSAGRDELKVIVAKNRQGQTGDLTLVWQGQFSRVLSKYEANETLNGVA